jgi:hypothetical protein
MQTGRGKLGHMKPKANLPVVASSVYQLPERGNKMPFQETIHGPDEDGIATFVEITADRYFIRIDTGGVDECVQVSTATAETLLPALQKAIKYSRSLNKEESPCA